VITVMLAVALLKERIDRLHIVPLALVIAGLVMIGVTV
jgi:multidrug transporter EmrE-like cation transporter